MRRQDYVLLPDVHTPFHSKRLIKKVCQLMVDIKPYGVVLTGDFLDLFTLSRYAENSLYQLRDMTLTYEYREGAKVMADIMDASSSAKRRVYLYGNHEDRYFRELEKGDNAKYGGELTTPEEALSLHENKWEVVTDWKSGSVTLGEHLEVIHGTFSGVNAAKRHLDEFESSVMFGHSHRFQNYVTGKRGAYNIGFLGDKSSKGFSYCPRAIRSKWVNGFAVVSVLDDGSFLPQPIQCWDDRFIYNGKLY